MCGIGRWTQVARSGVKERFALRMGGLEDDDVPLLRLYDVEGEVCAVLRVCGGWYVPAGNERPKWSHEDGGQRVG